MERIKINSKDLKNIIKETVNRTLNETFEDPRFEDFDSEDGWGENEAEKVYDNEDSWDELDSINARQRERLGSNAQDVFDGHYDWENTSDYYEDSNDINIKDYWSDEDKYSDYESLKDVQRDKLSAAFDKHSKLESIIKNSVKKCLRESFSDEDNIYTPEYVEESIINGHIGQACEIWRFISKSVKREAIESGIISDKTLKLLAIYL